MRSEDIFMQELNLPEGWTYELCRRRSGQPAICTDLYYQENTSEAPNWQILEGALFPEMDTIFIRLFPAETYGDARFQIDIFNSESEKPQQVIQAEVLIREDTPLQSYQLALFPNPAYDFFNIQGGDGVKLLKVLNYLGKEEKVFTFEANRNYDISDLPSGLYLVTLIDQNDQVMITKRLMKRIFRP